MKFSKPSPAERAALVRMVAASAHLVVKTIGSASAEFVDSIIGVQESEEEAVRESYL